MEQENMFWRILAVYVMGLGLMKQTWHAPLAIIQAKSGTATVILLNAQPVVAKELQKYQKDAVHVMGAGLEQ